MQEVMTVEAELLADLTIKRPPATVLEEARQAAIALKDVLDSKPNKVIMNDEQYLEFEDWQTVGKFYGVTCCEEGEPIFVEFGLTKGFKASSIALHNGKTISRATAFCLTDEEKWGARNKYGYVYCTKSGGTSLDDPGPGEIIWTPNPNKPGRSMPKKERMLLGQESVPLYQLASMAQTRANAKVLRNVLSWVVVLAGYKATPAEEMPDIQIIKSAPMEIGRGDGAACSGVLPSKPFQGTPEEPATQQGSDAPARSMIDPLPFTEACDRLNVAQSVKEISEVMNASLNSQYSGEERQVLTKTKDQAMLRLGKKK